eukprot:54633-Pyramimonas_sp.AAC.1
MAVHELQRLRRQAGQVAGGKARGRCLTTTLAVEMWKGDPAIAPRTAIISEWINLWQRFPEIRHRVLKAWHHIRRILVGLGPQRWGGVRGPVGA